MTQQERIIAETAKSLAAVDKYSDRQIKSLLQSLQQSSVQIRGELLSLAGRGSATPGLQIRQDQLLAIQKRIDAIISQLNEQQSVLFTGITKDSFQNGVHSAISEFGNIGFPTYDSLNQSDRLALATDAMSVIDTQALDFLTNYHLQLLGNVSQQLADSIKQELNTGIITGSSIADVVEKIGGVIPNPDEFRVAGKTVFKTAQQRIETITRTEILRAHNQGRAKFYQTVGVQKVTWITAQDERTCRECAPLDGKEFPIAEAPSLPRHPMCRCTTFVSAPLTICGQGEPIAMAAATGAGCIMPATQVQQLSKVQQASTAKVQQAFQSGDPAQLQLLTIKEIQGLAMQNGVAIARTKSDFIALLDQAEIGIDHSQLGGPALKAKLAQYKIGALRSKDELVKLLLQKKQSVSQVVTQTIPVVQQQALIDLAKQELDQLTSAVSFPTSVTDYQSFLASVSAVESKIAALSGDQAYVNIISQPLQNMQQLKSSWQASLTAKSSSDLKTLAKDAKLTHWQWASKDEVVTLLSSNDPVQRQGAVASIESKYAKWAEKHGGKSVKSQAILPSPPRAPSLLKPAVKPITQTVVTPIPLSRYFDPTAALTHTERDQLWEQVRLQPDQHFKFKRHANDLGGGHPKDIFVDARGQEWMFKPVDAGSEFAAEAETAAYKIGRIVDDNMVEVRVVKLNGQTGTIQRMIAELSDKSDLTFFEPSKFSADEIEQLQRHRVIDWLVSNHDGHVAQFLRTQDGRLIGIDKGQAWRYFPNDKLGIDYHPNSRFGEREPVYNTLFRMQKNGEITLPWQPILDTIKRLEQLSDDELWSYVESYATGRFQNDSAGLRKFKLMLVDRKNNLRRDFEAYIKTVDKKFKGFDAVTAESKASGKVVDPKRKQAEELIKKVDDAGWQGVTIDFDSGDVEDMNLLVFTEKVNGKPRTAVKMKLLKDADQRVHKLIKGLIEPDAAVGQPLPEDHYFDTIVSALKTIQSGSKKTTKIDAATSFLNELNSLRVSSDPDIKAMAERYHYWINVIKNWQNAGNTGLIPEIESGQHLDLYLKMPPAKKAGKKTASFSVKKGTVSFESRVAKGKEIEVKGNRRGAGQIFHRGDTSVQYQIDFGDGTTAYYTPTVSANNSLFAVNGEIEFFVDGKATPELLDRIIQHSNTLGINGKIATDEDIELMYLLKHGYVLKDVEQSGYKQLLDNFESTKASTTERIRVLRDYWSKKMGVKDVTKVPSYQPQGVLQFGTTGGIQQAGHRVQMRFDLSDAMLEKQLPGVSLVHSLTNDYGHIVEFFDQVLAGNGTLVSTVEKLRCGIPVGGMSPAEDMSSGGATYVFTRIKSATDSRSEGIYFKKSMLRRLDAISYDHDKYGRVTGNDVIENRHSTIDGFRHCAGRSGNETIFKYTVTLLDNIEEVRVNQGRRSKMLEVFKRHGISRLPDGRKVEEVVKDS